jgi:hypothetical protein
MAPPFGTIFSDEFLVQVNLAKAEYGKSGANVGRKKLSHAMLIRSR